MDLDSLTYGALDRKQLELLKKPTHFFTCDVGDLPLVKPMRNSDPRVAQEIRFLMHLMERAPLAEHFIEMADRDLLQPFEQRLQQIGAPKPVWLAPLVKQVSTYVLYLKDHYQRPRPNQLAPHLGLELHPYPTITGHSPAYPSGHSAQAIVVGLALRQTFGKHGFMAIAKGISLSRLQLGVHYPSDKKYGEYLGYWLFQRCQIAFKP